MNRADNQEIFDLKTALSPFVASFGFRAHDQMPARICSCSCVFLVINGHWVMCTAAHNIDAIEAMKAQGITLSEWHVNDVFTKSDRTFAYPFDVMTRAQLRVRDDALGIDLCLVYVEQLAAQSMTTSGVKAIDRESVGVAEEASKWVLTGFPAHFTKKNATGVAQRHYVIGVTPIDRPSNWELNTSTDALFGKLDIPNGEDDLDIGGMSGGPIFGLYKQDDGTQRIKLVAVQSGWSTRSRIITACPIGPFLDAVDRLLSADPAFQ